MNRTALYPGTFDPITLGHEDLIARSSRLCDTLIVGVAIGHHKQTLFSLDERLAMVEKSLASIDLAAGCTVKAVPYEGLLVELCHSLGVQMIIRGIRAVSDFDYEFQLAAMNRHLAPDIETLFLTPSENRAFISSTMVREVAKLGGNIDDLVALHVKENLSDKICHPS